jgi:UDP-N-acetylmuramate dehydrogenase
VSGLGTLIEEGVLSQDVPLGPMTTYKAGGPARWFATIGSRSDLDRVIATGLATELPTLVLGRGSNLVVADAGFAGVVVKLEGEFLEVDIEDVQVIAGGAAPLPRVARTAVDAGILGLEFFVGVPGSVGGAVRQNAGCFEVETVARLDFATIVDLRTGEERRRSARDLDLGYRHSNLASHDLVAGASFIGAHGDPERGRELMREITRWRRDHQPGGTLNAGSVFKNPPHIAAGQLLDDLGLKGMRVGDVAVSTKHANFFVAGADATAEDIYRLVQEVKDAVLDLSGTKLEPEIQFVGFEE